MPCELKCWICSKKCFAKRKVVPLNHWPSRKWLVQIGSLVKDEFCCSWMNLRSFLTWGLWWILALDKLAPLRRIHLVPSRWNSFFVRNNGGAIFKSKKVAWFFFCQNVYQFGARLKPFLFESNLLELFQNIPPAYSFRLVLLSQHYLILW